MNRRNFFLGLLTLPAVAKAAVLAQPDADLWKCVITPNVKRYNLRSVSGPYPTDIGVLTDRKTAECIRSVMSKYYDKKYGVRHG